MNYLKENFTERDLGRLDASILIELGVSDANAFRIMREFKISSNFPKTKKEMISILEKLMPSCARNPSLKQVFLYRNKVAAHQEALTDALKHQLKDLPSIAEIEKMNKWASDFCRFMACALTNTTLLRNPSGARIAALNVVARVLGKTFEPSKGGSHYQEREAFYSRL
jgi:hypothetical protein